MNLDVGFRYNLGGNLLFDDSFLLGMKPKLQGTMWWFTSCSFATGAHCKSWRDRCACCTRRALSATPRVGDVHIGCCITAADMPRLVMKRVLRLSRSQWTSATRFEFVSQVVQMLCSRLQVGIYAEEDKGSLHVQRVTEALKADGAEKSWGEFQRVKSSLWNPSATKPWYDISLYWLGNKDF